MSNVNDTTEEHPRLESPICFYCHKPVVEDILIGGWHHVDADAHAAVPTFYDRRPAGWIRLRQGNDWGFSFLMLPDCPSAIRGTHGREDAIGPIPEGTKLRCRMPGQKDVVECETFNQYSPGGNVSDHGHDSPYAGSNLPYVFLDKRPRLLADVEILREDLREVVPC